MSRISLRLAWPALLAVGICVVTTLLWPVASAQSPYTPRTVAVFEACRKAALAAYPGEVVHLSTRTTRELFRIRMTIAQKDDMELVVICDGTYGRIVRVVHIDLDAPAMDGIK